MIINFLIAALVIFSLLVGWIGVQQWARAYASRHPEFGPAREEGGGCFFCMCKDRHDCKKRDLIPSNRNFENTNPSSKENKS